VAGQHDDAKLDHALATFVLDVEIHAPVGMLGNEARQADRLGQRRALTRDPRRTDPRIVGTREADNECSTVLTHGLEVLERRWLREELSFGCFVGCDLDATDLVGEPTVRGVQLGRGGIRGREPAREYVAQFLLERERGAILDHDVLEPRDRRMSLGGKRLDTQALR
jgi:hypothetical protein